MTKRIQKNEIAKRIASRLSIDEKVSEEYLDAVLEILYDAFKSGENVMLKNLGIFMKIAVLRKGRAVWYLCRPLLIRGRSGCCKEI